MLPFSVTIPATVPQRSEIPEGLMNYPVFVDKLQRVLKWKLYETGVSLKLEKRMSEPLHPSSLQTASETSGIQLKQK